MTAPIELPQGTLDVLVLRTLSDEPMHGYGIARWTEQVTDDGLRLQEGTLYPALYRLENRGLIKAEWGITENNRRAKYYRLTAARRKQMEKETAAMEPVGFVGRPGPGSAEVRRRPADYNRFRGGPV
jgi:PadR family transcriptional regulator, regulatory protein PadR